LSYAFTESITFLAPPGAWNNFDNFARSFADPVFWHSLRATATFSGTLLAIDTVIGLGVAVILNQKFRGVSIVAGIVLLPWIIAMVSTSILWRLFFDPRHGIVNVLLVDVWHIIDDRILWFHDPQWTWFSLILVGVWKGYPLQAIMFLAAMKGVPVELHEVAVVDGANAWQRFRHITLPHLVPVLFLMNMFLLIWTSSGIEFVYTLTEGGPGYETMILPVLAYRNMFVALKMGVAAAQVIILLVIVALFLAVMLKMVRFGEEVRS